MKKTMRGVYHIKVMEGEKVVREEKFNNLILSNMLTAPYPFNRTCWCVVGTGVVTAPTVSDTDMGNQVASQYGNLSNGFVSTANGDGSFTVEYKDTFAFAEGAVVGDLSEIGLRVITSTGTLISRTLVKDGSGTPTTIPITATQSLTVTYTIYVDIPTFDPYAIDTGTLTTPHGSSTYSLEMYLPYTPAFYASLNNAMYVMLNIADGKPFTLAIRNGTSTVASTTTSYCTTDEAAGTVTVPVEVLASASGYTFDNISISANLGTSYRGQGTIVLDTPITVPANYNLTFDFIYSHGYSLP